MIVALAGSVLVVLGLFSGAVLVVAPLGLAPFTPGLALWVLFPAFCLLGYALLVIGAHTAHVRSLSLVLSALLVLLALAAAAGLVLASADVVPSPGGTIPLWYVLAIGGVLGLTTAGAAMRAHGWGES
jgi:hypothetical protein